MHYYVALTIQISLLSINFFDILSDLTKIETFIFSLQLFEKSKEILTLIFDK